MYEDKHYFDLLEANDPVDEYMEVPPDFDWETALERFNALFKALETKYPDACTRSTTQDATYLGEIIVNVRDGAAVTPIRVMISNFGKFAYVDLAHKGPSSGQIVSIEDIAEQQGYIVVPPHILHEPYSGKYRFATWRERYFSYL